MEKEILKDLIEDLLESKVFKDSFKQLKWRAKLQDLK